MQGSYAWQSPLQDAIQEHNPDEMGPKIRQAEVAIIGRIMAVSYRLDYVEEEAISEALARIRMLKSEARHVLKTGQASTPTFRRRSAAT